MSETDKSQIHANKSNNLLVQDISELWRNPPDNIKDNDDNEHKQLLMNDNHLTSSIVTNVLSHIYYNEMRTTEMTSLAHLLITRSDEFQEILSNPTNSSLSLSHEQLIDLPEMICQEFGPYIRTMDLSCNKFKNLDFLRHFTELTSLILDRNTIDSSVIMPRMLKLELLYLNFCNINDIDWVDALSYNCPNLKYLSLMGNPVAPSVLNGGTKYEHLEYRLNVIAALPNLLHLDDQYITDNERKESKRMYPKSFLDSNTESTISCNSCMPNLLRHFRIRINEKSVSVSGSNSQKLEKNRII